MACMEHICRECGMNWFDNEPRPICKRCKSSDVAHLFDEDEEDHNGFVIEEDD